MPAQGSVPVALSKKHKLDDGDDVPAKKHKTVTNNSLDETTGPVGFQWDGENYSCVYDSLFSIFYDIWKDDPKGRSGRFKHINSRFLGSLGKGFEKVLQNKSTLEEVRDIIRQKLHTMNAERYPLGKTGAIVGYLAVDMLQSNRVVTVSQIMCSECDYAEPELANQLGYTLCASNNVRSKSTLEWMSKTEISITAECPNCSSALTNLIFYNEVPQILICEYPLTGIKTSHKITFVTGEKETVLHLRGIVVFISHLG